MSEIVERLDNVSGGTPPEKVAIVMEWHNIKKAVFVALHIINGEVIRAEPREIELTPEYIVISRGKGKASTYKVIPYAAVVYVEYFMEGGA